MELLTRNNFESWMQKLMERIDRQDELLLSLQPSGKAPNPIDLLRPLCADRPDPYSRGTIPVYRLRN